MGTVPGDAPYGRRRFLQESVSSFVKTAQEFVKHRDAPREKEAVLARTDFLRPPGAVAEEEFLERCTSCSDCAKACPHNSITFDVRNGTPVIFPDLTPCYLCEDFPCIEACATEALLPVGNYNEVAMGIARIVVRDCTAGQGCNACVSQCPTHALAMNFMELTVSILKEHCVGCGLCTQTCKTVNDRIAIKVIPARLLS
jgi:ferredoxin-type protein NapG